MMKLYVITYIDEAGNFYRAERQALSMKVLAKGDPLFDDDYKSIVSVELAVEAEPEVENDTKPA